MNAAPRDRRPRRRGATTLETGVVIGACMWLVLGVFEYGRLIMMRNLAENAAREGARQAVAGTGTKTTAQIQSAVTGYLAGQSLSSVVVKVYASDTSGNVIAGANWYDAQFGTGIGVQVDASYSAMVPTFGAIPSTIHITARSVMQSEAG